MNIKDLLYKSLAIWKGEKTSLSKIVVCLGTIYSDLCRHSLTKKKSDREIKKELGNVIFSTIKWCDNLGFDPEECVEIAIDAQCAISPNARAQHLARPE